MKKIMFNDKYGLTQAVLEGRKTQTRRAIKLKDGEYVNVVTLDNGSFMSYVAKDGEPTAHVDAVEMPNYVRPLTPKYFIGEEVAVAQSYETMANEGGDILANMLQDETTFKKEYCGAGWKNKMFTKPDLMLHRIRITNIRIERLQDISNDDCFKEGVFKDGADDSGGNPYYYYTTRKDYEDKDCFVSPREAFAEIIDNVSGKGTWKSNPYVFVYNFEILK